jgi:hypothetical protein
MDAGIVAITLRRDEAETRPYPRIDTMSLGWLCEDCAKSQPIAAGRLVRVKSVSYI